MSKEYMKKLNFYEMHLDDKNYSIAKIDETELKIKYKDNKVVLCFMKRNYTGFKVNLELNKTKVPSELPESRYQALGVLCMEKLREFYEQNGYEVIFMKLLYLQSICSVKSLMERC